MDTAPALSLRNLIPQMKVADLARSLDFYTRVLGFRVGGTWPDEQPCWVMLDHSDVHIMLVTGLHEGPPHFTGKLALHSDDVMAIHARVKDHARVVYGPEVYHYGMKEFAIEDPDGYMISFAQETDEPPTCPDE